MNDVINRLLDNLNKLHETNIKLSKQVDIPPRQYKSTETKDLYTALAKAQGEMGIASLSSQNPFFKTRYADLSEIVRASRPALAKNGLSVTQQLISRDDGGNVLITTLAHNSGQYIESYLRIIPPKSDVQSLGSYITYLRRYSYTALVGIVTGNEDDDAEQVVADQRETFAKGPAQNDYQAEKQPYEVISKEEYAEIKLELQYYPDIEQYFLKGLRIDDLADIKKQRYPEIIRKVREMIQKRKSS